MENNILNNELEQMRQQMQVLKSKLDQQELVNERMITNSMKRKMTWIKKYIYFEFALIPILALLWTGVKEAMGISWGSVIFLLVMSSIDVYADYKINISSMKDDDYAKNNLIDTVQKLLVMKRRRFIQMVVCIPMVIIWLAWVGYEMYQRIPFAESDFISGMLHGGLLGGALGGVIGLIITFRIYFKMQRTNDTIIAQIKDFTGNE